MKREGFTRRSTEKHRGPLRQSDSHDEAPQAVLQAEDIEVHEQADLPFAEAQVGQELRFVHSLNGLDGLDLNDQFICNHDVRPKADLQPDVAVYDRNCKLALKGEPGVREFKGEAFLLNRLEKPWPEMLMNIDRQSDHPLGQFAAHQHRPPLWSSVVLGGSPCETLRFRHAL